MRIVKTFLLFLFVWIAGLSAASEAYAAKLFFSQDGKLLYSQSDNSVVRIYDVESGQYARKISLPSYARPIIPMPSSRFVAMDSKAIVIWNAANASIERTIPFFYYGAGRHIASKRDGTLIAEVFEQYFLINSDTGQSSAPRKIITRIIGDGMDNFTLSPDENVLATSHGNIGRKRYWIEFWNLDTGKVLSSMPAHSKEIFELAYSSDGKSLVTGSKDSSVMIWDVASRAAKGQIRFDSEIYQVSVTSRDQIVVSESSTTSIVDLNTAKIFRKFSDENKVGSKHAVSPDGKTLVTIPYDKGILTFWDIDSGALIREIDE